MSLFRIQDLRPPISYPSPDCKIRLLPAQVHATPLIVPSTIPYPKDVKSCQLIFKPAVSINMMRAANL